MADFIYTYGSKEEPVHSLEEWEKLFKSHDSRGEMHWKPEYSAQSLAEDFMFGSGEQMVSDIVELFSGGGIEGAVRANIEHASAFDKYNRTRMQDLAIFGKQTNGKSFFMGIEAKANETFGSKSINRQKTYVETKEQSGVRTDAGERLRQLVRDFLGGKKLTDLSPEEGRIRYQLLYYLAGSFREIADVIYMPVVVYGHPDYEKYGKDKNRTAYQNFMEALKFKKEQIHLKGVQYCEAYKKQITAPLKDGTDEQKIVYTCYIVK